MRFLPAAQARYDAAVVGGGFVGCQLALALRRRGGRVVVLEREADILAGASFTNQARVHNGYHYPRSLLTALRSRVNFTRFAREYAGCVDDSFDHYYAIASRCSKVTPSQFTSFCRRIGAPLEPAPPEVRELFDPALVAEVFRVREPAFDAGALREAVRLQLLDADVEVRNACTVETIGGADAGLQLETPEGPLHAARVFNCTYSRLNELLTRSSLPPVPLRYELAELALVRLPEPLASVAVTVMDGPFFSTMPFPPRGLHTLSHVRYTPHAAWDDAAAGVDAALARPRRSRFAHMLKDAQRYLPALAGAAYSGSLWEVKTLLAASEVDDSRPFLFKRNHGLPGLACVLGGKLDNVYDLLAELDDAERELAA